MFFLTFSFCYPPKINLVILKNNLLSYYFYVLQHKNKAFVQDNKQKTDRKHVL